MSALASLPLDRTELARLGVLEGTEALLPARSVLRLNWPELEQALPDHGLPRGVIEIAAMPRVASTRSSVDARRKPYPESMRGGSTSIAIAAMSATHAADDHAWCAWITPDAPSTRTQTGASITPSLYAPALAKAGVDLDRLLVLRPPVQALARTVVKAAASGAFALIVIDAPDNQVWGRSSAPHQQVGGSQPRNENGGALVVRKLALAAEESGTTSLLLTSALSPRGTPWPVALRLEVERRPDSLSLRVTKDRRGAGSSQHVVRLAG